MGPDLHSDLRAAQRHQIGAIFQQRGGRGGAVRHGHDRDDGVEDGERGAEHLVWWAIRSDRWPRHYGDFHFGLLFCDPGGDDVRHGGRVYGVRMAGAESGAAIYTYVESDRADLGLCRSDLRDVGCGAGDPGRRGCGGASPRQGRCEIRARDLRIRAGRAGAEGHQFGGTGRDHRGVGGTYGMRKDHVDQFAAALLRRAVRADPDRRVRYFQSYGTVPAEADRTGAAGFGVVLGKHGAGEPRVRSEASDGGADRGGGEGGRDSRFHSE